MTKGNDVRLTTFQIACRLLQLQKFGNITAPSSKETKAHNVQATLQSNRGTLVIHHFLFN